MALPTFISAGAGASGASNTNLAVPYPASLQANDFIILAVVVHDTGSTPSTPDGFTPLYGPDRQNDVGLTTFYKFATGSESGNLTVTPGGSSGTVVALARMYAIRGVPTTSFIEGASTIGENDDVVTAASVTTSGADRLAVNIIAIDDDDSSLMDSFTGETGGDWVQAVADFNTSSLNDGLLDFQIAEMPSAGTISGGDSVDLGALNDYVIRGFALKPNLSPTVVLNSPVDASSDSDTTPTLDFTGTDAEGNDIRYQVQIFSHNPSVGLLMDSYSEANQSNTAPIYSGGNTSWGQSFLASGTKLSSVKFYLSRTGAPTGTVTAKLYAHSGTFGSSSVPTGSALATSDPIDISTISTSLSLVEFTFSGDQQYSLSNGTHYVIAVDGTSVTGNIFELLNVGLDDTSPTHAGNGCFRNNSGTWNSLSGAYDIPFYLYTLNETPSLNKVSGTDSGFANPDNGGDTDPFTSGENVQYTVQAGDALSPGTYYWRVRGIDPAGSNTYGAWSSTRSFTVTSGGGGPNLKDKFFLFFP